MAFAPPRFWQGKTGWHFLLACLLVPFGYLLYSLLRLKLWLARPQPCQIPVLCVGNIALGGSGKTPFVLFLAKLLQSMGEKPAILSRGYGGRQKKPLQVDANKHSAAQVGEESLLLAQHFPVFIARRRAAAAELADKHGASVLLMDDGLQHTSLQKDLTFLLFDPDSSGNGFLFPAGPLRETLAPALARSDALVLVGKTDIALPEAAKLFTPRFSMTQKAADSNPDIAGKPVIAFAGIARPERFFAMLQRAGANLIAAHAFADHHFFTPKTAAMLLSEAKQNKACLITTEKDAMRLRQQEDKVLAELALACHRWHIDLNIPETAELGAFLTARLAAIRTHSS